MGIIGNAAAAVSSTVKERLVQALVGVSGIDQVEHLISSKLESDAHLLQEIPHYLLTLGGKRVRPILALLCAKACGAKVPPAAVVDVAAGIELIHMATLLHDDIIDNSPLRRHKTSPYKKFGLGDTLLAGDFLLVRAFSLCARLDRFIIDSTERACVDLTEGEILETSLANATHTEESSITIARKKTASLFWLAARSGSHLTGATDEVVENFSRFGENLGIAFQMVDDILDVTADESLLGKKSGTDIRERKPAIVNVLWLKSGSPLAQKLLREPNSAEDEMFVASALKELRGSAVVEEARALARTYIERAENALQLAEDGIANPDRSAFQVLRLLIEYAVARSE